MPNPSILQAPPTWNPPICLLATTSTWSVIDPLGTHCLQLDPSPKPPPIITTWWPKHYLVSTIPAPDMGLHLFDMGGPLQTRPPINNRWPLKPHPRQATSNYLSIPPDSTTLNHLWRIKNPLQHLSRHEDSPYNYIGPLDPPPLWSKSPINTPASKQ